MAEPGARTLAARLTGWARRHAHARWLPAPLTAFPAADFVIPVMPNQLLLIGLSLLAPARWPVFALAFALSTAAAGAALAFGLQSAGFELARFVSTSEVDSALPQAIRQFERHGLWFLAGVALLPWTPRVSVVACALAGFAPLTIFATLLVARIVPCTLLGLIGAHGPRLAGQSALVRRLLDRAQLSG